jgi:hypothetical protein
MEQINFSGLVYTCLALMVITICGFAYMTWHYQQVDATEHESPKPAMVSNVVPAQSLSSKFQHTNGWTGGDGAYSIPLSETKTLWLFGDSWIGNIKNGKRQNAVMINNAAAWQSLDKPNAPMQFFWRTHKGKPASLIPSPVKDRYYWPMDGALVRGKLYIFVRQVRSLPKETGPFAFKVEGAELLSINNPTQPPPKWNITHIALPPEASRLELGSACLAGNEYLYAYGTAPFKTKTGTIHNLCVARMTFGNIEHPPHWEYYTNTGWRESDTPFNILPDVASELSVKQVPGIPGYVATWVDFKTRKIMMSRAQNPEGQWCQPEPLYACCEPATEFVYSAKHHPELTTAPGQMMLTYCRNVRTLKEHMEKPNVYAPVAVLVKLQTTSESAQNEQ